VQRATLLGARHVPERLCGGYVYLGRYIKCSTFTCTVSKTNIIDIHIGALHIVQLQIMYLVNLQCNVSLMRGPSTIAEPLVFDIVRFV